MTQRYSGHTVADPAKAASRCTHRSFASATPQIASVGSNAVVDVEPAVAHTKNGTKPATWSAATMVASSSASIRCSPSVGTTRRWPARRPATRAPFSSDEWVSEDT